MTKKRAIPELVGIKEASAIMGWDQRKVSLYTQRGKFPEPIQRVAATPLWIKEDIELFAANQGGAVIDGNDSPEMGNPE